MYLIGHHHPDVIVVPSGLKEHVRGWDACVKSNLNFGNQALAPDFRQTDFRGNILDDTAVLPYFYEIKYEHGDKVHRDIWHVLLVPERQNDFTLVAWRTTIPDFSEVRELPGLRH